MDDKLKRDVSPFLARGERLLWAGKPTLWRFVRGGLGLFLFGIPWTAFALFWEGGVLGLFFDNGPVGAARLFMALFGLPFIAIGVLILSAPFQAISAGRRMRYAVTDGGAYLIRLGRKPEFRRYGAGDLIDMAAGKGRRRPEDVCFAIDRDAAAMMPSDMAPAKGGPYTPVAFVGLTDAPRVRALLEQMRLDAPSGTVSRQTKDVSNHLEAKGSYAAVTTKLEAWLAERRDVAERVTRTHWTRYRTGVGIAVAIGLGLAVLAVRGGEWPLVLFIAIFVGGGAFATRAVLQARTQRRQAMEDRGAALGALLSRWRQDAHPKTPVRGFLDLGDSGTVRPYRTAHSPYSGALKTYHRHHWARLTWGLADGSLLTINVVDRVKLKSGNEMSRMHQVRGRLSVNPAYYDAAALGTGFRTPLMEVRAFAVGDRVWLGFRTEIATMDLLRGELEELYRQLRGCARPVVSQP